MGGMSYDLIDTLLTAGIIYILIYLIVPASTIQGKC